MADSNFENRMIDDFKKMLGSKVEFYQPTILYYEEIKINRKETKSISFPFVPGRMRIYGSYRIYYGPYFP